MADTKYLKLHGRTWQLHYRVPTDVAAKLGKRYVSRSLKTGDIREAQRRRNELVGELEAQFRQIRGESDWQTPQGIVNLAYKLRVDIATGAQSVDDALEGLSEVASWNQTQPAASGYALEVPKDIAAALKQAHGIVQGGGGIRLSEALSRHLEALAKTAQPTTVNARRRRVTALCDALSDPELAAVTRQDLARHVLALTGAVKTRKITATDIGSFFGWCRDAGMIDSNPGEKLSRLVRESSRGVADDSARRPWTDAEVRQLLQRVEELRPDDYLRRLVPVALFSGMRIDEICSIQGKDIEDACFVVREGKTKSSLRRVPIHPKIAHLVEGLKPNDYLIPGLKRSGADNKRGREASKRFAYLKVKRWGFPAALVFHGLRASFISKLENAGVPVSTAELIVGHRRQSMSYGTYSKGIEIDQLREAVEKVSYVNQ
jgi:integrase